jgi:hypothetical protein
MTATPGSAQPPPAPGQGTVVVRTKTFPLAFLLLFFKTIVTLDGTPWELPWGESVFPVAPGVHEVHVAFKYFFGPVGANSLQVQVAAGQTVTVAYRSPFLVFMKGKIQLVEPAAGA